VRLGEVLCHWDGNSVSGKSHQIQDFSFIYAPFPEITLSFLAGG
jgi:hypothetical protein